MQRPYRINISFISKIAFSCILYDWLSKEKLYDILLSTDTLNNLVILFSQKTILLSLLCNKMFRCLVD